MAINFSGPPFLIDFHQVPINIILNENALNMFVEHEIECTKWPKGKNSGAVSFVKPS